MTLGQLAQAIRARVKTEDAGRVVERVASLAGADASSLTFLADDRYRDELAKTRAGGVILREEYAFASPSPCLICENPHASFARAAALLHPAKKPDAGVHPTAVIAADVQIDATAHIGALAVIGAGCRIGAGVVVGPGCILQSGVELAADVWLVARVTVGERCIIGARTTVHPGAVIGADGFGLAMENGHWLKVPQLGRVCIGDDVEIGANTTVDRGALEDTIVSDGVKIDNLVQIAHNVRIGEHTAIAGCVGIAGSSEIGPCCTIGGGVGIAGHLRLTDHVHVTGMSLVARSLEESGTYSSSMPAQTLRSWQRNAARFRHLDEMAKTLKRLEDQVQDGLNEQS